MVNPPNAASAASSNNPKSLTVTGASDEDSTLPNAATAGSSKSSESASDQGSTFSSEATNKNEQDGTKEQEDDNKQETELSLQDSTFSFSQKVSQVDWYKIPYKFSEVATRIQRVRIRIFATKVAKQAQSGTEADLASVDDLLAEIDTLADKLDQLHHGFWEVVYTAYTESLTLHADSESSVALRKDQHAERDAYIQKQIDVFERVKSEGKKFEDALNFVSTELESSLESEDFVTVMKKFKNKTTITPQVFYEYIKMLSCIVSGLSKFNVPNSDGGLKGRPDEVDMHMLVTLEALYCSFSDKKLSWH
ncbi:hypothetical protein MPSEU_000592300 [Mayamaea pseudoterrestris]|nr:hypothetical protein MPSEU_000592300 [Mayamaea pseudoterrestris]